MRFVCSTTSMPFSLSEVSDPCLISSTTILKHPNVAMTADGNAGVYTHGEVKSDVATIELISFDRNKAPEIEVAETNYELLSDEDFDTN